jgi:hypothetical protein
VRRTKPKEKKLRKGSKAYKELLAKVMNMSFEDAQRQLATQIGGVVGPNGGVIPPPNYRG